MAEVEQLCIDSSPLLKWQLLDISQYYLTADVLFDESTELSEKWLPNGILLDMVGAEVLAWATNGPLGVEDVDIVELGDELVQDFQGFWHLRHSGHQFVRFLLEGGLTVGEALFA